MRDATMRWRFELLSDTI